MIKTIKYNNSTYEVEYDYSTERSIVGTTNHVIIILKVNNIIESYPYFYRWSTSNNKPESIIIQVYNAINEYLARKPTKKTFSYLDEFENWNGELDNWDE